jgi:hypothetical protein
MPRERGACGGTEDNPPIPNRINRIHEIAGDERPDFMVFSVM